MEAVVEAEASKAAGPLKSNSEAGLVVHSCNPSTREAEAARSQVEGQPGLHRVTLSQINKQTNR